MTAPTTSVSAPEAQHGLTEHSHGPGSPVPVQSRAERFASPRVSDFGDVTGFEAEWKLTPVDRIRALLGDGLDGSPLPVDVTLDGPVEVTRVGLDDPRVGRAGTPEDRASANARSSAEQVAVVTIREGEPARAVLVREQLGQVARAAHTLVIAEPLSTGLVIIEGRGDARLTENVEIVVGEGARLTVVSLQQWATDAVHLASHFARVEKDGVLRHVVASFGGGVVRVDPSAHLAAEGADVELFGAYFAESGQHLEQRVYVHHDAPHGRSRVSYKGALEGAGARTVWVGDVLIGPDAVGTDSYEQNRNLVLTEGTRADSIPNLEIETGDIAGAGHASATGRFDDEQLFYLASRGIPEAEARRLVVLGFLGEIVQKIGDPAVEAELYATIEGALARGGRNAA